LPAISARTWMSRIINAGFVWRFGPAR
jgi:hypothetical protein